MHDVTFVSSRALSVDDFSYTISLYSHAEMFFAYWGCEHCGNDSARPIPAKNRDEAIQKCEKLINEHHAQHHIPVGKIEIDKEYVFTREHRGRDEQVAFIRFVDGTPAIYQEGAATIWKEGKQPWEAALADLHAQGFAHFDGHLSIAPAPPICTLGCNGKTSCGKLPYPAAESNLALHFRHCIMGELPKPQVCGERRMRKAIITLVIAFVCLTTCFAQADVVTVPTGLNPGDQYRLIFTSSTTTDATSTSIATYNAFVTRVALSVPQLAALGTTWNAIGSTDSINTRVATRRRSYCLTRTREQ